MKNKAAKSKAWTTVQIARHPERPQFLDYVGEIFTEFDALHGDRLFGDDGAMIGGLIAVQFLHDASNVSINPKTIEQLSILGIDAPNGKLVPDTLFENPSPRTIVLLIVGGLLIGFGSRYAGGCTSGHAISGLSNLQLPSLKAVIGFFIGGLVMAHFLLPLILNA